MTNVASLSREIDAIKRRNAKVEMDKAWETSTTRKMFLAFSTYIVIGLYMNAIGVANPWLNAIIPAAGFLLSTLTLPFIKHMWMTKRKEGKG